VEWSLNSRDFAGSREPTPKEISFFKKLRKEAWDLRKLLAQLSDEDFPIFTELLREVCENPSSLSWFLESKVSFGTDTPEPGENPDSNPNPIQGDLPDGSPGLQPGDPFNNEGERR